MIFAVLPMPLWRIVLYFMDVLVFCTVHEQKINIHKDKAQKLSGHSTTQFVMVRSSVCLLNYFPVVQAAIVFGTALVH